jgi:hypothetical protein
MLSTDGQRVKAARSAGSAVIKQRFVSLLRFAAGRADSLALLVFIVLLYFYLRVFRNALIDDAFITLDYVRNIIRSGTWGFFPGHVANTATSPLNVILLTITSLITGSIVDSPIWLALCCFAIMAIALERVSLRLFGLKIFGRLATLAFVLNPLIISTIGLESILFSALLVLSVYCLVARKWFWLAFVLGMLSLTRAEGLLFAVIFVFAIPTFKTRVQFIGILLLSIAPWYLFSWIHLGSLIPDSLIIRMTQTFWQGGTFWNGPVVYLRRYPAETLLSFAYLPLFATLLLPQVRNSPILRLLLVLGLVHYIAYSALAVPPFHWYYVPESAIVILFGALTMGTIYMLCRPVPWQRIVAQAVMAVAVVLPVLGMYQLLARDDFKPTEMPIHTNLASQEQYRQVGLWLKDNVRGHTVQLEGEIGTLAYYCDCHLLDAFSDRRWLTDGVHTVAAGRSPSAALYRLNFLFLRDDPGFPPYAYLLTVRGDPEATTYPHVKEWETSTRWSPHSWIVLGQY